MSAPGTCITILHLSDIQLGKFHRFEPGTGEGSLFDRLREDLDERDREDLRPDLVLLTGDLAEWGLPSEFKQVETFANTLASHLGLRRNRIVLIPGNHDINRKASSSYFDQCLADEQRPVAPYWPKWRHFAEMFACFYEGEPGITFTQEHPWAFFEYPDLQLVVAALNSTMADSHRDEDHIAFVGESQIRWFAERLRQYEEQSWLRIGAVHHDPARWREETRDVPADKREEVNKRVEQDLRDLERRLWPRLNLLVHGHIHEEQFRWLPGVGRAPVPALGIGSGGLNLAQRPAEVPNQYQWIRLHRDRLEYGSRAYVPDQKRWIGDNRVDERGERWWVSVPYTPHKAEQSFAAPGAAPSPTQQIAPRLARYRSRLTRDYSRQGLFDISSHYEDARIESGLTLLEIFVPQHVAPMEPEVSLGAGDVTVWQPPRRSAQKDKSDTTPTSLEDLLLSRSVRWSFLVGAAGAGKSALSRWLVLRLCDAVDLPAGLEELVPVRLELRLFEEARQRAKSNAKDPPLLLSFIEQRHLQIDLPLSRDEIVALAEQGKIYWIFDGLDEVADEKSRQEIAEELNTLHEKYSGCRCLVTSRPGGLARVSASLSSHGYEFFSLEPFDDAQIQDFLKRWHPLAFPGNPEIAENRKQRLLKVVAEHTSVRELCTNPLLLTLVALINRGDELPRRRYKLYERATELMIVQWDANKGLTLPETSRFQPTDKWKLLRRIAWSMVNRRDEALNLELPNGEGNVIEQEHLERIAEDFCKTHYSLDSDEATRTARQLLKHLRERNYVLALLGGTTFGFVHRTFLEYLAARELVERFRAQKLTEDELSTIVQNHQWDGNWKEVLLLACGIMQEEKPELIVRILQKNAAILLSTRPENLNNFFGYFYVVVLGALSEFSNLTQEPVQSFCRKLAHAIKEATCLSGGARPRFPVEKFLQGFPGQEIFEERFFLGPDCPTSLLSQQQAPAEKIEGLLRLKQRVRELIAVGRPRRAVVKRNEVRVGLLEETASGTRFTYDEAYRKRRGARAISPALPLRAEPFEQARGVLPFFSNLLPEGALLDSYCRKFSLSKTDVFGLLLVAARDVAGAVSVFPEDEGA